MSIQNGIVKLKEIEGNPNTSQFIKLEYVKFDDIKDKISSSIKLFIGNYCLEFLKYGFKVIYDINKQRIEIYHPNCRTYKYQNIIVELSYIHVLDKHEVRVGLSFFHEFLDKDGPCLVCYDKDRMCRVSYYGTEIVNSDYTFNTDKLDLLLAYLIKIYDLPKEKNKLYNEFIYGVTKIINKLR